MYGMAIPWLVVGPESFGDDSPARRQSSDMDDSQHVAKLSFDHYIIDRRLSLCPTCTMGINRGSEFMAQIGQHIFHGRWGVDHDVAYQNAISFQLLEPY